MISCDLRAGPKTKTPAIAGVFEVMLIWEWRLLDFAFLIHDMLARYRVVLFHFKLVRCRALILIRGVKVPGTRG